MTKSRMVALRRLSLLAALAFVGSLVAATVLKGGENDIHRSSALQSENQPGINGLWRSRGYGWLWSINGNRIKTYDVGGRVCIHETDDVRSVGEPGLKLGLDAGGRTLLVRDGDEAYAYVFDRIAALPDACHGEPDSTPVGVLNAVDDYFSAHYPFFSVRKINWPALVARARSRLEASTDQAELFQVLTELLSQVPDDHVSLEGRVNGRILTYEFGPDQTSAAATAPNGVGLRRVLRRWNRSYWKDGIAKAVLRGRGKTIANDKIQYGLIDGDIGYLNIRSMEGFSKDENNEALVLENALDRALTLFAGARSVIVDMTANDGGYDYLARQIVARFANVQTRAYSKYPGDTPAGSPNSAVQNIFVKPSVRPRFAGPVYVLTSELTVSAAEVFTIAMRALPNVIHVGEATRGSLSDLLDKPLPNGWWLSLSNEVYLDVDGEIWEGRGIQPQVEIEVFSKADAPSGHIDAVARVVELARNKRASDL